MPATVKKEDLSKGLSIVSKAVNSAPIVPLLGTILVDVSNGKMVISGTNMEIGIIYSIDSKGKGFKTCVPVKVFNGLVDAAYTDELELELEQASQSLKIVTDTSQNKINCIVPDEFPPVPRITKPQVILPAAKFKEMIGRTAFAARKNDPSSPLSGVLMVTEKPEGSEAQFVMFATDGYHMSFEGVSEDVKVKGKSCSAIVRAEILEIVSRILPSEGELQIQIEEKHVMFHCGSLDVVTQQLAGEFPNYTLLHGAIPKKKVTLTLNTLDLFRACKQLRVFAVDNGNSKLEVGGMIVNYSTLSKSKGNSTVSMAAAKKGADITIGINVHFLYHFLEVCKTEQVVIEMSEPTGPIVFKMKDYKPFYHIIMPIRFEEE